MNEDSRITNIIVIAFWLALLIGGGYYFYNRHQEQVAQELKSKADEQKAQSAAEVNKAYTQTLQLICDKKVQEITGAEFFQCQFINDPAYQYRPGLPTPDMESDLAKPDIPAFCKRKIGELTGTELVECLTEKPTSNEQGND